MSKLFWKSLLVTPAILGAALATGASAQDVTANETLAQINQYVNETDSMGQLRSVNQLSDVRPTDWAYQALRSLVERYGCVAGYPDGTFRGNRAMTRYEAAALVNACLDTVNDLIAQATADLVTQDDLAQLQRLQDEFREELAVLRARVDSLEAKVQELEANQFSTTTKLKGEALFVLADAFGDGSDNQDASDPVFGGRVRLNLQSSFTGSDLLRVRLEAENIDDPSDFGDRDGADFAGFAGTQEFSGVNGSGGGESEFRLDDFWYRFSIGKGEFAVGPVGVTTDDFVPTVAWDGGSFLADYFDAPPIYENVGDEGGLGGNYQFNDYFNISAGAITNSGNTSGSAFNNGITDEWSGFAQLTGTVGDFEGALAFAYDQDIGNGDRFWDRVGTENSADPFDKTSSQAFTVGLSASYQFSERFIISGYGAHQWVDTLGGPDLNARSFSAGVGFVFPDLFREGNEGGIAAGVPPTLYNNELDAREDDETPIAVDIYYTFRISDNITITPGGIVLINGNGQNSDDTEFVGSIRTKFKF